jgi:hypothetical protein
MLHNTLIQNTICGLTRRSRSGADTPIVAALPCHRTVGQIGQPRAINSAVGDGQSDKSGNQTIKLAKKFRSAEMAWPVVEDGLRLDVHRAVLAGKRHRTSFRWQWTCDGEVTGWISVTVTFDDTASGTLALKYNCNGKPFDQRFRLEADECRFGGHRWFAISTPKPSPPAVSRTASAVLRRQGSSVACHPNAMAEACRRS